VGLDVFLFWILGSLGLGFVLGAISLSGVIHPNYSDFNWLKHQVVNVACGFLICLGLISSLLFYTKGEGLVNWVAFNKVFEVKSVKNSVSTPRWSSVSAQ
jgi:hypothetical protein